MSAEVLFAYYLVTRRTNKLPVDDHLAVPSSYENTLTSLVPLCSGCARARWEEPSTISVIQMNRDHGNFATLKVHTLAMDKGEITSCADCGSITREEFTRRQQARIEPKAPAPIRETAEVFGEEGEG